MIITSKRRHGNLPPGTVRGRATPSAWYCQGGVNLPDGVQIHYRKGCPHCYIGFMENARGKNLFRYAGDATNRAVYNHSEARKWFFYLYEPQKEIDNEGE